MRRFVKLLLLVLAVVTVVNWTWARLPGEPPLPPASKFAIVDGRKIHYVDHPGKGPAVVMIHGMPGTWGDWNAVAARLKGRHTIEIDRPGYAFSQEGYLPFAQQVQLVNRLTHKLGLKRPVIAGHSYGGAIALSYAFLHPDEVSGIVAVDPAVSPQDIPFKRKAQARFTKLMDLPVLHQLGALTVSNIVRRVGMTVGGEEAFSPDPVDQGWMDRSLSLTARYSDLDTLADELLNAETALGQLDEQLSLIHIPVEIIQGEGDKLVPTGSVQVAAKRIQRSHLQLLSGGHMQTYTHPDVVAEAIVRASK
jgi:pimeloyl-ACP methyl ester carboxylesterase